MSVLYEKIVRPVLFAMDAERAHRLAVASMRYLGKAPSLCAVVSLICRTESSPVNLFGLCFPNPIGLAAGMDKNAEFPQVAAALGFGHVEVGTITPNRQLGNPRPRIFRYRNSQAIVNRMGFNNDGAKTITARIARHYPRGERPSPLGINVGKAKSTNLDAAEDDYIAAFKIVAEQADYVTINISSPNTPSLRTLQEANRLDPLLKAICEANIELSSKMGCPRVPILLKISPDESFCSLDLILELAFHHGIDGIIATNTTLSRSASGAEQCLENGGLSGAPLSQKSTEVIRYLSKASQGHIPLIGVGGILDSASASEKLDAGASLVQIYTGLVYKGPLFVKRLARGLAQRGSNWL